MTPSFQTLAWHGFECSVPAEWEVTAFSQNPERGRLLLETRRGPQAEVSWRRAAKGRLPDLARMVADPKAAWRSEPVSADESETGPLAEWRVREAGRFVLGFGPPGTPAVVATVVSGGEARLCVFWTLHTDSAEGEVAAGVRDSWRDNLGPRRRWAIWGLDLSLPAEFELEEVRALPGDVALRFAGPNRHHLQAGRLGLTDLLLEGRALTDFHRGWLARQGRTVLSTESRAWRGLEGSLATFTVRRQTGLEAWLGRAWPGRSLLRFDPAAKRLHSLDQYGPDEETFFPPDELLPRPAR